MGFKVNQTQVMVPYDGKLWYDEKTIANIFSLTDLVNRYIVAYDSQQYDAFSVHTNKWVIKSRKNKQGLHVFNFTYTTEKSNVFTTAEEKMVGFTIRQIDRAKLSKKIYNNVGIPTVENFKHMVSTNVISNCPISVPDISNT